MLVWSSTEGLNPFMEIKRRLFVLNFRQLVSSVQCIHKQFYLSKIYFLYLYTIRQYYFGPTTFPSYGTFVLGYFGATATSDLRHFRPTVLPSYDTSELLQHRSYDISVLRYFRPTIHWSYCNIGPTTAVGRMYIIFC